MKKIQKNKWNSYLCQIVLFGQSNQIFGYVFMGYRIGVQVFHQSFQCFGRHVQMDFHFFCGRRIGKHLLEFLRPHCQNESETNKQKG